ncbi:hypothetical protein V9T40_013223 [Parthenolecanium corni]|uniref:Uncharacterized protein n=1 Tax=Parthenolecanium corni TaxID=536013 RepID=A0AAN9TYP0_9HEMI
MVDLSRVALICHEEGAFGISNRRTIMQPYTEAVEPFRIKIMKKKLDSMMWKLEEYEKNIINTMKDIESADSISTISLIQSIYSIREHYENLREEIAAVQQSYNEARVAVGEEMNAVLTEFNVLKNAVQTLNKM